MATYYHISPRYTDGDLLSLYAREATMGAGWVWRRAVRWALGTEGRRPEGLASQLRNHALAQAIDRSVNMYLSRDGQLVSLHASRDAALDWREDYTDGSQMVLLTIEVPDDAEIETDANGCPAIRERIPANWIVSQEII